MENKTQVKIHVTHKDTGLPAVGYIIDIIEIAGDDGEKITDANGTIDPFYMDMNNFIYADVFVRDQNDNIIAKADGQYPLIKPETVINIEV